MRTINLKACAVLIGLGVCCGVSADQYQNPSNVRANQNYQTSPNYSNYQTSPSYNQSSPNFNQSGSSYNQSSPSHSEYQSTPSYYYQDSGNVNRTDFQRNQENNMPLNSSPNNNMQIQRDTERQPLSYLYAADNKMETAVVPDQDLAKKIHDKIGSGMFSKGYDKVTVDVQNGVVTLGGTVKTQSDKDKVVKEIGNFKGVKKINNQITVEKH